MPLSKPNSQEQREPARFCLKCGYCLHGLPINRCPECGREFDPDDPFTFSRSEKSNLLTKWLARPPSKETQWLAGRGLTHSARLGLIAIGLALAAHVMIATSILWGIACFFLWTPAAALWIANLLACMRIRPYFREFLIPARKLWFNRAVLPLAAALIIVFLHIETPLPFIVHYWARRPAFEALKLKAMELPPAPTHHKMTIGGLSVSRLQRYENGFRFLVDDMDGLDAVMRGFVYWEKGPLPDKPRKGDRYYRISPRWYGWTYTYYRDEYRRNGRSRWWPYGAVAR